MAVLSGLIGEKEVYMFNSEEVYFDADYYYASYKGVYRILCEHILGLEDALECNARKHILERYARKLYNYSYVFEGYTDCLYDLRIINEADYYSFYDFVKAIRVECMIFLF